MHTRFKLLTILANGGFYSGDELGATLGIGRSAVWRQIQVLRNYGLDVYAVNGRGYRLGEPLELLSEAAITESLPNSVRPLIPAIELHYELDSTNSRLMRPEAQALPSGTLCLAEYQRAGRGRQGRRWVAPFGSNLCFSMVWRFQRGPETLSGLSPAVAVGVAQGLMSLGLARPGLKWPNDLYIDGDKLAGILLEMNGESSGASRVVVGVGVNLKLSGDEGTAIDQPWTALDRLLPQPVSRNRAAAAIVGAVAEALVLYEREGFTPFLPWWRRWDVIADRPVTLQQHYGGETAGIKGLARGIDGSGALLIEHDGEINRYLSGEVALLRPVAS